MHNFNTEDTSQDLKDPDRKNVKHTWHSDVPKIGMVSANIITEKTHPKTAVAVGPINRHGLTHNKLLQINANIPANYPPDHNYWETQPHENTALTQTADPSVSHSTP
jgi:hypothetical protein